MTCARARVVAELHRLHPVGEYKHAGCDNEALSGAVLVGDARDLHCKLGVGEVLMNCTSLLSADASEFDPKAEYLVVRILERVEELLAARASCDGDVLLGGGHTDHSFQ